MVITFDCRLVCSTSKSIAKFHRFGKFSAHYKFFKELVIDFQSVTRFDYKLLTHFYFHLSLFLLIVCYSFIRFVGLSYHGSRLLSWLHRRLPWFLSLSKDGVTALYDRVYFTTNFLVMSPTLMKYIPCGNADTSICCVSAVMVPVIRVWPIRLVMR